jgi:signal transduction histidine kinase
MDGLPEELKRKIDLSNSIYRVSLILLIFYEITELITDFENAIQLRFYTFEKWVPFLLSAAAALGIVLNRNRQWKVSRIIFLTSWIILVNVMPVLLSQISPSSYFVHPVLCIISSLMIHLFFSWYEDRWTYIFFLVSSFFLTAFSFYFLSINDSLQSYERLPLDGVPIMTIYLMSWVFINATLVYVYRINWKAYVSLQEKTEIIEGLNHSLEAKVEKRTMRLREQNEKLREFAFINSHVLRAPVSRILGLVNLLVKSELPKADKEIVSHLGESAKELDTVIRNLSVTLQEARDKISDKKGSK